jgi:hypothetical protein
LNALKLAGQAALLIKRDIKGAFRHIAIREVDRHLHGLTVKGKIVCETTLTFGMRTSPPLWDRAASALAWILKQEPIGWQVIFYVDDFLLIIPKGVSATSPPNALMIYARNWASQSLTTKMRAPHTL